LSPKNFYNLICKWNNVELQTVTSLTFTNLKSVDWNIINLIANRLPQITYLDLKQCIQINNDDISLISEKCSKIEYLNLANISGISDRSLRFMAANLSCLKWLDLSGSKNISDIGIVELSEGCLQLEVIYLQRNPYITLNGIKGLAEALPTIRELSFTINEENLEMNDFDILDMAVAAAIQQSLQMAIVFPCLQKLILSGDSLENLLLSKIIKAAPLLNTLSLVNCSSLKLTWEGIVSAVGEHPSLQILIFEDCTELPPITFIKNQFVQKGYDIQVIAQ